MAGATRTLAVVACAGGCADWPRFANLPQDDTRSPDQVAFEARPVRESTDWADEPQELTGTPSEALGAPWTITALVGTLETFGVYADGPDPVFDCPADVLSGSYTGDVDFVRVSQDAAGPICLVLDAPAGDAATWDVVLYAFDDASSCIDGPFLTSPSEQDPALPAWTEPGQVQVADAPAGELAIYLAGAAGTYPPGPVDYTLYLFPVPQAALCAGFVPGRFEIAAE